MINWLTVSVVVHYYQDHTRDPGASVGFLIAKQCAKSLGFEKDEIVGSRATLLGEARVFPVRSIRPG